MRKLYQYFLEVVAEGKKVTWPPRKELVDSTWIVMGFSVMCGVLITGVDFLVSFLVDYLLKGGA
ncbi:MAG: preprotein translocase subunit SecE [Fibrobacteres bacterium]|nr:preprotein translocase subunit SecE [Fibrobacterota bacterium]